MMRSTAGHTLSSHAHPLSPAVHTCASARTLLNPAAPLLTPPPPDAPLVPERAEKKCAHATQRRGGRADRIWAVALGSG